MSGCSTRTLLRLGVAAWCTVGALAGAAGVAAAVFVAAWAFVYGDHPWPSAIPWIIAGGALLGAAAGAVLSLAAARRRWAAADARLRDRPEVWRWAALGVSVLAALLAGGVAWVRLERDAAEAARLHEHRRSALAAAMHRPVDVSLDVGPRAITVSAILQGQRAGRYRWQARLVPASTSVVLAQAESTLELQPGAATRTAVFDTASVLAAWHSRIMGGGVGSAEQQLVAQVSLAPELTAPERQLEPAEEALRRTARASTKLRLVADADGIRLSR